MSVIINIYLVQRVYFITPTNLKHIKIRTLRDENNWTQSHLQGAPCSLTSLAPPLQNCLQARLLDLVTGAPFRVFMVLVVCLNLVALMVETDQQSGLKEAVLTWLRDVYIALFVMEVLLKLAALRQHYFTDGWNLLDLALTTNSILGEGPPVTSSSEFIETLSSRFIHRTNIWRTLNY